MTTYAAQKGRGIQNLRSETPSPEKAPPLSDSEKARIESNKEFVIEHMPELLPFIRDLHAQGMIAGWRSVRNCRLIDDADNAA